MRKILSFLFVFLFLFSACKKQPFNEVTTSESNQETITNKFFDEITTRFSDLTEAIINTTRSADEKNDITENKSELSDENEQHSSPVYIFIGLDELKDVKNAFDEMEADDFQTYMETEHIDTYMTGMWDYESSASLLDEMCSTYVPVLDNNPDNLSDFAFYWKNNCIDQLIIFGGDKRVSVISNTAKYSGAKELNLGEEAIYISQKNIEKDGFTARLHEVENADYNFFAEIIIGDTYIILRGMGFDTMEDFEECFNRLTFIKIDDLINQAEVTAAAAQADKQTAEITAA